MCWTPGHSHPNTTILAHTEASTQRDILGHSHIPPEASHIYAGAVGTPVHSPVDAAQACVWGGAGSFQLLAELCDLGKSLFFLKFSNISRQLLPLQVASTFPQKTS